MIRVSFVEWFDDSPKRLDNTEHRLGVIGIEHTSKFAHAVGKRRSDKCSIGDGLGTWNDDVGVDCSNKRLDQHGADGSRLHLLLRPDYVQTSV